MYGPMIPAGYDILWSIVAVLGVLVWLAVIGGFFWMVFNVARMRKDLTAMRRELALARGEDPLDAPGA
ncbi:hypothetical protein [Demequina sp. NBRC 110052]|uniref:hypothetical protein n=1 Tax=Demequina sp. NBRC 110052 TaxID=1570341 RepID=UPI00117E7E4C|nr:hypothetical protein [Demequina sp. NBRC 110052]